MAAAREVRVLVVHRDALVAEALDRALSAERGMRAVGAVSEPTKAIEAAAARPPEVAVVDLGLPGDVAIEAVRRIADVAPRTAVVALSNGDDLAIARAVEAGAAGHVPCSASLRTLAESVRRAARGDTLVGDRERRELLRRLRHRRAEQATAEQRARRLTPREVEILQLMADGVRRNELVGVLGMSPATLRTHVQNIIMKLGVHSKTEALAFAIRHGRVAARA